MVRVTLLQGKCLYYVGVHNSCRYGNEDSVHPSYNQVTYLVGLFRVYSQRPGFTARLPFPFLVKLVKLLKSAG
jgi:hypothetical protein